MKNSHGLLEIRSRAFPRNKNLILENLELLSDGLTAVLSCLKGALIYAINDLEKCLSHSKAVMAGSG